MDPRGPQPTQKTLKRALFVDIESFFESCLHDGPAGQTFSEFKRLHPEALTSPVGRSCLRLMWLGSQGGLGWAQQVLGGLLSAAFAPLAVDVEPPPAGLSRALRMLTGTGSVPKACDAQALLDVVKRHTGEAVLCIAVTDGVLSALEPQLRFRLEGPVLVYSMHNATSPQHALALLAAAFRALGLSICRFYACLLGPQSDNGCASSCHLCPVCLRKLGSLLGPGWDCVGHYRGLRTWFRSQRLSNEAAWCNERLQVITECYEEETVGGNDISVAPPSQPDGSRQSSAVQVPTSSTLTDRCQQAQDSKNDFHGGHETVHTESIRSSRGSNLQGFQGNGVTRSRVLPDSEKRTARSEPVEPVRDLPRTHKSNNQPQGYNEMASYNGERRSSEQQRNGYMQIACQSDFERRAASPDESSQRQLQESPGPGEPKGYVQVVVSGRRGVLSDLNGRYFSRGEFGGRRAFYALTKSNKYLYLYYLKESDYWAIGPELGSSSIFADCGPSNDKALKQVWRVWDGTQWNDDPEIRAAVAE